MTEEELIDQAEAAGGAKKWATYLKMCGPGFLQSACTIGGGTLASCLFMGSIVGLAGLWIQPTAIVFGVIVLGLIAHVTLAQNENPFTMINRHVSPILGWGWLVATVAANMIWVLPQYNLAVGALTKNVFPEQLAGDNGKVIATAIVAACATAIIMIQLKGGKQARLFDRVIQLIVALIVLCFGAVVIKLFSAGDLNIGAILGGLVPKPSLMFEPASTYNEMLAACGDTADYWSNQITNTQKNVIFAAIGSTVGINMTFLLPYSLRDRKWSTKHMTLSRIDLSTGLIIPFVLVTLFVISAASVTLHGKSDPALTQWKFAATTDAPAPGQLGKYRGSLEGLAKTLHPTWAEMDDAAKNLALDSLSAGDKAIAAATLKHGTAALAAPLQRLFGGSGGTLVFGIGVFFIALSTILMLMLINGYAMEAAAGLPRWVGCLLPLVGVLGPFVWGSHGAYLAIPTSVIGLMLLPVAIWGFFFVAREKSLGKYRLGPLGTTICGVVATVYTLLSGWAAFGKIGWAGPGIMVAIAIAALLTSPAMRKGGGDSHGPSSDKQADTEKPAEA